MIDNYYQVFQMRSTNHGKTFKETVQNQARHDFMRFLQSSPNTIDVTINDKVNTQVATIVDKSNDTLTKRFFLCKCKDKIQVGDFLYWKEDNSVWLMFKKEKDIIKAYDKFEGIECKHMLKWIDSFGILKTTPCYLVAQTDEKIKANFRTWNNMITPQPNKFLEIITSRQGIELGQKFLLDETAWYVVESDYISVKNILYLSLTEDKKDQYQDDIDNDIANIVDLDKFKLEVKNKQISLGINEEYELTGSVYLNGNLYSEDISVEVLSGKQHIEIAETAHGFKLTALSLGSVELRIYMEENNEIYQDVLVQVEEVSTENVSYNLVGDSSLKWGRTKTWSAIKTVNGVDTPVPAHIEIEDKDELLASHNISSTSVMATANRTNKTGSIKISCTFEGGETIVKEIAIVSLWM